MWTPGTFELVLIFLAIILLFGAQKLPELARAIGRSLAEFKHAQNEGEKLLKEFESTLKEPLSDEPVEHSKASVMVKDLGIEVEGKTDDELLDEIRSYMPPTVEK
ncbi:MAG TPA: twin-arginine translocase TatA/TatE family subunit [Candidatus Cloacimonetes bacterium]|nr:twin-arginine translocase TatA/TatE family subunit [Candidatus Cloacimonadota bacterium]